MRREGYMKIMEIKIEELVCESFKAYGEVL